MTPRSKGRIVQKLRLKCKLKKSKYFQELIIHEVSHASFDLTNTSVPRIDNESTSYISQGAYLENIRFSLRRMDRTALPYFGRMIANDLRDGGDSVEFWMSQMHRSLRRGPMYRGYIWGTFHGYG